jgi:Prealbumin-like fold domain
MDDGDEVFDDVLDTLVFGPAPTDGGTVETGPLDAGWYWIVETTVPDGYTGSDPILVELNLDDEVTCIWDAAGLVDCVGNDGENEVSSWTWVEVENTPEDPDESPDGSTLGETGTPEITLPPTDTVTGANDAGASQGWRLVILAMAGLIAAALLLTPARLLISTDERRR